MYAPVSIINAARMEHAAFQKFTSPVSHSSLKRQKKNIIIIIIIIIIIKNKKFSSIYYIPFDFPATRHISKQVPDSSQKSLIIH